MQFSNLLGLLPFLASAQAFFILSHPVLTTTRMDPIVQPGGVSQHVHSIVGGSNFDHTMTYESARASGCTTAAVSEDKSNYWTPQLYYYNPKDATYQAIPVAFVNTYYLNRAGRDGKVQAFPDGLRMVSGNPYRRTFNNDAESKSATFVCLDYSGSHKGDPEWAERNSFFKHNCPNGMRAQIFFRSCWDGVNLDSPDHISHMAWPSGGVDGGECPASHPVRVVSLFYEFIYQTQNFPFNDPQYPTWVFANGDTTGYGMHGDFLNGWPAYNNGTNILQAALDDCNDDNGVGGVLQNCPPFVPFLDQRSANSCGPQNKLVAEDVGFGRALSKLPGDNPIWIGNSTIKPSTTNYTESSTNFTDFKSIIPDGYTETGCIAEGTSGRALNAQHWSADNMTRGACVSWCQGQGYPLAGVQYGRECRCDTAIRNGGSNTTLLPADQCSMKCAGNSNERCGGGSVMNLFNNPSMYPTKALPTGWKSFGCYTEGSGVRALGSYSFASGSMTQELCMTTCQSKGYKYAGAEWARECYCANSFGKGSVQTDEGSCDYMCAGDDLAVCGGSQRLTVFGYDNSTTTTSVAPSVSKSVVATTSNVTTSAIPTSANATSVKPVATSTNVTSAVISASASASKSSSTVSSSVSSPSSASSSSSSVVASSASSAAASPVATIKGVPAGWAPNGCMTEATSGRALSAYSFSDDKMTYEMCLNGCSARGYKFGGVEYSRECYCGDGFNTGSVSAPDSQCSSKCAGDATAICGGGNRLTTFAFTSSAPPAVLPAGWTAQGCFAEPASGRALSAYTYASSKMTTQLCIDKCASKGYSVAATQYGSECYCDNSLSKAVPATAAQCGMSCSGDITTRCGAGRLMNAYTFSNTSTAAASPASSSASASSSAATASSSSAPASSTSASVSSSSAAASSVVPSASSSAAAASSSASPSPSAAPSSSSSSIAPSSTSSAAPVASAVPVEDDVVVTPGWVANGCYTTGSSSKALTGYGVADKTITHEKCQALCFERGFKYAGIEYGSECRCGDGFQAGAVQAADSECRMKCAGNSAQICGNGGRLTTFVNNDLPDPAPLPQGWSANGCYAEPASGRALKGFYFASKDMTTNMCISTCASKGFSIAGTQYGSECYCSSAFTGGAEAPALECQSMCSGVLTERCGGGRRLSTYTLDGAEQPAAAAAAAPAPSSSSVAAPAASSSAAASSVASSAVASSASSAAATTTARAAVKRRSSRWN